jgi:hypothetical protein
MLFPTTIVGSFPRPDWRIDRRKLAGRSRRACAPTQYTLLGSHRW